ncbi:MAG: hypothetical protein ABSE86_04445 [Bryobacteraceae bacterium]|jgi:hypothetical protein
MILHRTYWPAKLRTTLGAALAVGLGILAVEIPASADTVAFGVSGDINGFSNTITNSQVLYASTPLGGDNNVNGCIVGLCTLLTDPTASLTTSPNSSAPGLLAYSTNLSADGSNATVSGSLAAGNARISLSSVQGSVETNVSGGVTMEDGVTFNFAGGGTRDIGFQLTVDGSITVPTDGSYVQSVLASVGAAQVQWGADFVNSNGGTPVSSLLPGTENWVSYTDPINTPTQLVFSGLLAVTSGQDLGFLLQDQMNCNAGAVCDFGDPIQFSLNLPQGVTFTSDSGVFLSGVQSTPTPEPRTWGFLGAYLLALGLAGWRKRMAAN